jgi:hypothetical protein
MGLRDGIDALRSSASQVAPSLGSDCYILLIHVFSFPHLSVSLMVSPYLHKIPQIPPFIFFFGAYCVRLLHFAYLGYWKDTFHALGWVENHILWDMHRRIPLAFP